MELFLLYVSLSLVYNKKISLKEIFLFKLPLLASIKKSVFIYTMIFPLFALSGMASFFLCKKIGIEFIPSITEFIIHEENKKVLLLLSFEIIIIAPFIEEIIFRGIMYNSFRKKGILYTTIMNSTIFAVFHKDIPALLPIFVLGISFSLVYEKYKSLWYCIILHSLHNSIMISAAFAIKSTM